MKNVVFCGMLTSVLATAICETLFFMNDHEDSDLLYEKSDRNIAFLFFLLTFAITMLRSCL